MQTILGFYENRENILKIWRGWVPPMRPYLPAVGAACSSAHRDRSPSRKMPLAVMLPKPLARAEPGSNLKFLPSSPGPGMGGSSSQVTCRNLPRFTVILFSTEPLQLPFSTHSQGRSRIQGQLHTAGRTARGWDAGKGEPRLRGGWFFTAALDRNPHYLAEGCDRPLRLCCPAAPRDKPSPLRAPARRTLLVPPCDARREKAGVPAPAPPRLRSCQSLWAGPHPSRTSLENRKQRNRFPLAASPSSGCSPALRIQRRGLLR